MRVAICDDEEALCRCVEGLVEEWGRIRDCPCRIAAFPSGEALLFEAAGSYPFDLILLDVEMGGIGGVELARTIRAADERVPIAFLTNHPHGVFQGYEVSALRYLLKPADRAELFALLDLARERAAREPEYLVLNVDGAVRRVDQADIVCLEARGHTVVVRTAAGDIPVRGAFSAFARSLGGGFVPAHRSFLVNLRHVERVGRTECLLTGGIRVPVSRGAREALSRAFIDYYKEG